MDNLVTLYLNEIKTGTITIDDVPAKLKDKVQAVLDEVTNNTDSTN
jgi:hypothetical protein